MKNKDNYPKAIAIYEAVLQWIHEEHDLPSLTVSEIAKRAGVGKGTVYDYFQSKEEIVAKTYIYGYKKTGALHSGPVKKRRCFSYCNLQITIIKVFSLCVFNLITCYNSIGVTSNLSYFDFNSLNLFRYHFSFLIS